MAALPNSRRSQGPLLIAGAVATAYLATRLALLWRFPWFVDETTFASFAKDVHGNIDQFFIAESDKKGLLASWMGAGLIGIGIDPVTAMRLLSVAGAGLAAACGGFIMRGLFGVREGLLTAGLVALGPFFLVNASVGIYDPMVTGLVALAILIALRLAKRPRLATAVLLGAVIGAGCLTKPTAWITAAVLPATWLLVDSTSPDLRRRLTRPAVYALVALAIAYAIASVARLTPLYDQPVPFENQRGVGDLVSDFGPHLFRQVLINVIWTGAALVGYLTPPGLALTVGGAVVAWRRRRRAAVILGVWTTPVLLSMMLLPVTANPRYLATAIVPLAGFTAVGACAAWDAVLVRWSARPRLARRLASAGALAALLPAVLFNASVLTDPGHASYPGLDERQYVTYVGALAPLDAMAREIRQRGGPYPARVDAGPYPQRNYTNGPWGLDLLLNGKTLGRGRRYEVFAHGTPAQLASARYLLSDGARSDTPPRPGYTLIRRIQRSDHGAVMRLYERTSGYGYASGRTTTAFPLVQARHRGQVGGATPL